jgi:hypothetical protein
MEEFSALAEKYWDYTFYYSDMMIQKFLDHDKATYLIIHGYENNFEGMKRLKEIYPNCFFLYIPRPNYYDANNNFKYDEVLLFEENSIVEIESSVNNLYENFRKEEEGE